MTEEAVDDLRTTAETTKADAERLAEIEAEKLQLAPEGGARLTELAAEATRLVERLGEETQYQEDLAREVERESGQ
jgi:hypothetical protein